MPCVLGVVPRGLTGTGRGEGRDCRRAGAIEGVLGRLVQRGGEFQGPEGVAARQGYGPVDGAGGHVAIAGAGYQVGYVRVGQRFLA